MSQIHLGGVPSNVLWLESTQLDCSKLFACQTTAAGKKTYKLLHNKSSILALNALDSFRKNESFEFLPTKIYVRDCMQEIFHKIVTSKNAITSKNASSCIIFGSPGVGKSVLAFLAALCFVQYTKKPLLFLRKTTNPDEDISVFWITPDTDDGKFLKVQFDRQVKRTNQLPTVQEKMFEYIFSNGINNEDSITSYRNYRRHLRLMCDGPKQGDDDYVGCVKSDLVTSGGYEDNKDEAMDEIYALPLSAWTMKEMIQGCRHLFRVKAQRVKEIFDVCGGNFRMAMEVINKTQTLAELQTDIDTLVDRHGKMEKLQLALASTKLSSDENSIGRLRTMFALPVGNSYTTVQFIGSPYLFRKVRSEVSLDQTLEGLRYAKNSGIQSLYGWHFELFGHKIFQLAHKHQVDTKSANNPSPAPKFHEFAIVEGKGTGKQSVNQLDQIGAYWMPSNSNFANIDAAIALVDILYCIQYTVAESHTFNFCTFASDFWEVLSAKFRAKIKKIIVVFVVPHSQTFKKVVIPKSQETLRDVAKSTCCTGLEKVFRQGKKNGGDDDDEEPKNCATKEENATTDLDGDVEMSSSNGDDAQYSSDDDSTFFDDDCGEEGFDDGHDEHGKDDDDMSKMKLAPIHFQWEQRSETFDVDRAPLSFLEKK